MAEPDGFDPYRLLGLARDASPGDVAREYRALAKRHHPDLHGPDASRRMQELNRAFRVLSDPAQRSAWDAAHPHGEHPPQHWAGHQNPAGYRSGPSDPASWARWEAGRTEAPTGPARVRVGAAWPRQPAPVRSVERGLRDSGWLAIGVAALLLLSVVALGWVASHRPRAANAREAISWQGIAPTAMVALTTGREMALYEPRAGVLGLIGAERDGEGWQAGILTDIATTHPASVLVYSEVADDGSWPPIAFGRAPAGISRVEIAGGIGRGGDVTNGTWLVLLPSDAHLDRITWEFLADNGTVLLSGSGELGR